jgi:hypothetical protein
MKFKTFLKEQNASEQDIKEFEKFTKDFHVRTTVDWISYESDPEYHDRRDINELIHDQALMDKVTHFQIAPNLSREFYWPNCLKDYAGQLLLDQRHPDDPGMIVNSFDDFPVNVKKVEFTRVMFNGTKGIEKLNQLKEIYFRTECYFNNCGLLWILKSKVNRLELHSKRPCEFLNAFEIVKKHFDGDRDVAECMDELMEAGLKDYARS